MKDNRLKAVHDDDLSTLLTSLGLYDKIQKQQCVCHFCQRIITLENLGAIIPLNGEISLSCDMPGCLDSMVKAGE